MKNVLSAMQARLDGLFVEDVSRRDHAGHRGPSVLTRATLLAAFAAFVGGCNGSTANPLAIEDLPKAFADAVCNNIGPCCSREGIAFDQATCHATAIMQLTMEIEQARVGRAYDGNAARACMDAWASASSACTRTTSFDASCQSVFVGMRMAGETCESSSECADKMRCTRAADAGLTADGGLASGQCAVDPGAAHAKKGDKCSTTCYVTANTGSCTGVGGSSPDDGVCYTNDSPFCDFGTKLCTAMPALGGACNVGTICADKAICDNGVCATPRTTGPCTVSPNPCNVETAYCDTDALVCKPKKAIGEACTTYDQCPTNTDCKTVCKERVIASDKTCSGRL